MATLYVTSSADSGDGTFRDCVERAVDGDVITARQFPFECVLSQPISITSAVTINGLAIWGGTGSQMSLQLRANITFNDCVFAGLYKQTSGGPLWAYAASTGATFNRCRLFNNYSEGNAGAVYVASGVDLNFRDCLIFNNAASNAALYFNDATMSGVIENCTIYDNCGGDINKSGVKSAATNCLLADTPSSAFANPVGNTDKDSWVSVNEGEYSYYLTANIVGTPTTTKDVYGNVRTNTTKGAIDYVLADYFLYYGEYYSDPQYNVYVSEPDLTNKTIAVFGRQEILVDLINIPLAYRPTYRIVNGIFEDEVVNGLLEFSASEIPSKSYICANFIVPDRGTLNSLNYAVVVGTLTQGENTTINCDFRRAAPISFDATFNGDVARFTLVKTNAFPVSFYRGTGSGKVYLGEDIAGAVISDTTQAIDFTCDDGTEQLVASTVRTYYYKGGESGSFTNPSDWAVDENKTIACVDAPTIAGCTFIATE